MFIYLQIRYTAYTSHEDVPLFARSIIDSATIQ